MSYVSLSMIKELTYQIIRQLKNLQNREMSEQDLSLDTFSINLPIESNCDDTLAYVVSN